MEPSRRPHQRRSPMRTTRSKRHANTRLTHSSLRASQRTIFWHRVKHEGSTDTDISDSDALGHGTDGSSEVLKELNTLVWTL